MHKIAYFSNVHLETKSSAAGRKTLQVLKYFQSKGFETHYFCSSLKGDRAIDYAHENIIFQQFEINQENEFNKLEGEDYQWIIYDRFMVEEQISWQLKSIFPEAIHAIESQDFHAYRKFGENIDPLHPDVQREIAAYLRSDYVFVISKKDMVLLQELQYPASNLIYWPFTSEVVPSQLPSFEDRKDFFFIGNGFHQPNQEAILYLKKEIWPSLRKLTKAKLHLYGAYFPPKITQLHNPKENFIIHGSVEDVNLVMQQHRVQLVPLQSGAGLKGKILEGFENHCPSVGTPIAFDGYPNIPEHLIIQNAEEWSNKALKLYDDQHLWENTISSVKDDTLSYFYPEQSYAAINLIMALPSHQSKPHRKQWIYQLLNNENHLSKKYLSLYIIQKNK